MLRIILVIDDYNELIYLQTLLKKMGFDVEGIQNTKKYQDVSLGFNPQILITSARGSKVNGLALAQGIIKMRGYPKIIALGVRVNEFDENKLNSMGIDQILDSPVNPKKLFSTLALLGGVDEEVLLAKYAKIKGYLNPMTNSESTVVNSAGGEREDHDIDFQLDDPGQASQEIKKIKLAINELTGSDIKSEAKSEVKFPIKSERAGEVEGVDPGIQKNSLEESAENIEARQKRFEKIQKEVGELTPQNFDRERIMNFNKIIRSWPQPEDLSEIEDERKKFVKSLFTHKNENK
ncbi:MAG: hypothetical protein ABL927_07830 [Bdellovibrionales bacterium]